MRESDAPLAAVPMIDPRERAWLTYRAMANSDNIVLLLQNNKKNEHMEPVIAGANDAFLRASGYSEDQIRGRPLDDFFRDKVQVARLRETIRRSESLRGEEAVMRADGTTFTLGFHLMPVPEDEEPREYARFVILGRDITAILEARNMQAHVQKLLAKVFTCINEAVAIIDEHGRVAMTNPHVDRLLGYKANGLIGRKTIELVAPSGRELMTTTVRRQMEDGRDVTYEVPVLREDGTEQQMRVTSVLTERDDRRKFRIITLRPAAPILMHSKNAGQINLVGLEEVRDALGSRWSAVSERAMATAETVIKRRCGEGDTYSRADDISFLICFGTPDLREASFRAATIGREIRDRLLGQGGDAVSAQVRAVAAAVMLPYQEDQPIHLDYTAMLKGLEAQMRQIEEDARQTLKLALTDVRSEIEPIRGRNPEEIVCTLVRLPDAVERKLLCAYSILPRHETDALDLNGLLLTLAAGAATAAMARGESRPLLVPVRFEVFSSRAATERYIGLCRKIDQRLSKTLIFLISELPEGLPKSRLFECVNLLRPYCRGVGFQVDDPALLAPVDPTTSGRGIVAFPESAVAALPPAKLKAIAEFVHAKRMKLLIRHLGSTSAAARMLTHGADLVSMAPGTDHYVERTFVQ
jgi:PAS domain S-box-containing protein